MAKAYGPDTTTEDLLSGVNLQGKRAIVTGVSSGLGIETARALAAHGAQVIGTARDLAKAEAATYQVSNDAVAGGGSFEIVELNLSSLASVRACANQLLRRNERIDLIVANAGVMAVPFGRTVDGFETQFGTNYLGHFVFVNRLASLLHPGARVIALSSASHRFSNVELDDPNFERTPYDPWKAYGRSKTAAVLFAVEFDRRHREEGIRAAAVHPGGIHTGLSRHIEPSQIQEMVKQINEQAKAEGVDPLKLKTIEQGAATSIWAGVVASPEEIGGRYCENCHASSVVADTVTLGLREGVRSYALDPENAKALWKKSEELVAEPF